VRGGDRRAIPGGIQSGREPRVAADQTACKWGEAGAQGHLEAGDVVFDRVRRPL
jgi:hypothetical protein